MKIETFANFAVLIATENWAIYQYNKRKSIFSYYNKCRSWYPRIGYLLRVEPLICVVSFSITAKLNMKQKSMIDLNQKIGIYWKKASSVYGIDINNATLTKCLLTHPMWWMKTWNLFQVRQDCSLCTFQKVSSFSYSDDDFCCCGSWMDVIFALNTLK